MSLDKSIEHGKEHRKPYFGSKSIDGTCRNHGSCSHCRDNRLHSNRKREMEAEEDKVMKDPEIEEHFIFPLPNGTSISSWAKAFTTRMKALADGYHVEAENENGEYIWEKCDRDVAYDEAEQLCHSMFNLLSEFAASGIAQDIAINELSLKPDEKLKFYKKALEITFKEKDRMEKEYYLDPDADYYEEDEDEGDEDEDQNNVIRIMVVKCHSEDETKK